MKTIVFSAKPFEIEYFTKLNAKTKDLTFSTTKLDIHTASEAAGYEIVAVFTNDDLGKEVIEKLHALGVKHLITRSAGHDHVHTPTAEALGMKIGFVPEYSPFAIAEHTIALILALNRKIVQADKKVKNYDFTLDNLIGFDLNGKTVGLIGTGKIGGIVGNILKGFGCKIIGFDVNHNPELEQNIGLKYVSLEEIWKNADIISFHCPMNEHTKYLLNDNVVPQLKDGVFIINTARGGIIETKALLNGIKSGKIGAAGLDVYEKEKGLFFYDHVNDIPQDEVFAALLAYKNVIITGHQAFLTKEAITNIIEATLMHIDDFENDIAGKWKLC